MRTNLLIAGAALLALFVASYASIGQGGGGGGGAATWGTITGTLSSQSDLNTALGTAGATATWGQVGGDISDQADLVGVIDDLSTQISAVGDTVEQVTPLAGDTDPLGGGALLAGACASTMVAIGDAAAGMVAIANPTDYPGDGIYWKAYVSGANEVTVKACAAVAATPVETVYHVKVLK